MGRSRWVPLTAVLAATTVLAMPSAAQREGCGGDCDTTSVTALRRGLERAREDLDVAAKKLAIEAEALGSDSSRVRRDAFRQAQQQLASALTRYQAHVVRQMREESRRIERDIRVVRVPNRPEPQGWLGVNLSGDFQEVRLGDKRVWKFRGYPTIEGVEPDSPADRAGFEAGDLLITVNGQNVQKGIEPFTMLLRPGNRVPISVQREGETRQLTVLVERRPEGMAAPTPEPLAVVAPMPPSAPTPTPSVAPIPPTPAEAPEAPLIVLNSLPPIGGEMGALAGAELRRVGELKEYFGVADGVLVLRVSPQTPAARAGLRDGDVIVMAAGRPVSSVSALQGALERHSGERKLSIEVVRRKAKQTLTLSW